MNPWWNLSEQGSVSHQGGTNLTYGLQGETEQQEPKMFRLFEEETQWLQPFHTFQDLNQHRKSLLRVFLGSVLFIIGSVVEKNKQNKNKKIKGKGWQILVSQTLAASPSTPSTRETIQWNLKTKQNKKQKERRSGEYEGFPKYQLSLHEAPR